MAWPTRAPRGVAVATVAAVLALAACSSGPGGEAFPTPADVARAQTAWTDPWLALDEDTAPPAPGPIADVIRPDVGSRTWEVDAGLDAVGLEEEAARAAGWSEVEMCADPNWPTRMWRKGTGDDALLAALEVAPGDAANTTTVTVTAYAHHHLSSVWPGDPDPTGCLRPPVTQLDEDTTAPQDDVPVPELDEASAPAALDAPAAALEGDAVLARLGLTFTRSTRPQQSYLAVPLASADVPDDPDVPELAAAATDAGWSLTFTLCRPGSTVLAELRRDAGDGAVAILRLTTLAGAGTTPGAVRARAVLTRPAYGGPPTAPPAEPVASCWEGGPATTGAPWFGPELAVPVQE